LIITNGASAVLTCVFYVVVLNLFNLLLIAQWAADENKLMRVQ